MPSHEGYMWRFFYHLWKAASLQHTLACWSYTLDLPPAFHTCPDSGQRKMRNELETIHLSLPSLVFFGLGSGSRPLCISLSAAKSTLISSFFSSLATIPKPAVVVGCVRKPGFANPVDSIATTGHKLASFILPDCTCVWNSAMYRAQNLSSRDSLHSFFVCVFLQSNRGEKNMPSCWSL